MLLSLFRFVRRKLKQFSWYKDRQAQLCELKPFKGGSLEKLTSYFHYWFNFWIFFSFFFYLVNFHLWIAYISFPLWMSHSGMALAWTGIPKVLACFGKNMSHEGTHWNAQLFNKETLELLRLRKPSIFNVSIVTDGFRYRIKL